MNLQINKDTKLYGSFSETPGNNGCLFFNAAFEKHIMESPEKYFTKEVMDQLEVAVGKEFKYGQPDIKAI